MCGLTISQGDFVCASIEAELKEEVYVEMLEGIPGMQYVGTDGQRCVCRVNQSFFGAHQSSSNWEHCLRNHIVSCDQTGTNDRAASNDDGTTVEGARAIATKHMGKLCGTVCKSDPNLYLASKHYPGKQHADICL